MSESPIKVPLLDLKPQYEALAEELNKAVTEVVQSQHFILGREVECFEHGIASACLLTVKATSRTQNELQP